MTDTILVVDVGTSSARGILYEPDGKKRFSARVSYTPVRDDQSSEISPRVLSDAFVSVIKQCADYARLSGLSILCLSLTAQRSSFLPVDADGAPLTNFMTWQDTRSLPICDSLKEYNAFIYRKTGMSLSHVPLAPKLTWFIVNHPSIDKRTAKYLTIADYLIYFMTGAYCTDYTYGSRTLLMDIRALSWDPELLELFHVDERKLCPLVPQGSVVGEITREFSDLTGLPRRIPVVTAGGDQQCGALGAGRAADGETLITVGTGTYITTVSDNLLLNDQLIINGVSAIPGKYQLESFILTGADFFDWYKRTFYPDSGDYAEIDRDAANSPLGSNGIITLPYFRGKGSPNRNPNAAGLFYGTRPDCGRGDFARSILEGIIFEIDENLHMTKEVSEKSEVTLVTGGLSNFPLFNQTLANISGREIETTSTSEAASTGALLSAAAAARVYDSLEAAMNALVRVPGQRYYPDSEARGRYDAIRAKRKDIYKRLFK